MQNNKNFRVFSESNRFFLPLLVIFFMTWVTLSLPGVCRNNDNQNMNNTAKKERKKYWHKPLKKIGLSFLNMIL